MRVIADELELTPIFFFSTDSCFKINHNTAKQVMLVAFLKLKVYNLKDASLYNIYLQVGQHII